MILSSQSFHLLSFSDEDDGFAVIFFFFLARGMWKPEWACHLVNQQAGKWQGPCELDTDR